MRRVLWARLAVAGAVFLWLAACTTKSENRSAQSPTADSATHTVAVPNQTASPAVSLPWSFPPLTEEVGTNGWILTMVSIHVTVTANRQPHEKMPKVVGIKGRVDCHASVNQHGPLPHMGDKAVRHGRPTPVIAPCMWHGELAILYAPHRFYQMYRSNNPGHMHDVLRGTVRDYLALLTQRKLNDSSSLATACAAGRLVGGLRDQGYLTPTKARSLELGETPTTDWGKIYITARDTGACPLRWLGQTA